ncbi:Alpha/Beta hydrolase protein [Bisporella sp. PMI_857]|nr:Alpha/Beta hydrolase protein [Bisporella sp. PMI_857]
MAAFAGNNSVIESLLELGGAINIDAPGGKYGCALKAADDQGHFEAVMILLKAGATKTLKTPTETPSTDDVDNGGEEGQPEPSQIISDAVTSPTPTSGWPLNCSTANLVNLSTPTPADDQSQPSMSWPEERPQINTVGFSCISNPEKPVFDIVFVHGLQGHPEKTWTHQPPAAKKRLFRSSSSNLSQPLQHSVFWPYDLLSKHPDFSQARILTWGYDSKIVAEFFGTSDQQNISQHGNDLMVALQQERKREPARPLIFVAHSLGGILVKVTLDNSKRSTHQPQYLPIYDSTNAIIFLGTPHGGSTSTNWGLLASNLTKFALQGPSERIIKGLKPNSELLENLRKVFLQMLEDNKFKIHTFYETKSMLGMYGLNDRVVPYDSALVGHARQEIVRGINGNHSEICKFSCDTDPGYRAVLGALEDYIMASTEDII